MRKVNIQSGKQSWVSHHRWDSKAFNRNTHSLSLVNKARFSVCADLNSACSSLGNPARCSSWETAGGLGGRRGWAALFLVLARLLCKGLPLHHHSLAFERRTQVAILTSVPMRSTKPRNVSSFARGHTEQSRLSQDPPFCPPVGSSRSPFLFP